MKSHLKSSASSKFWPLHWRNPAIVGLFCIHLHVFVTFFKSQNDVTLSNTMTYLILQWQLTSASVRFPQAFNTVTLLFHITQFFRVSCMGDVFSNWFEPWRGISNNVVCATSKGPDQPAHKSSLIRVFASRLIMSVKLLTEHNLEFLSLKGGHTG